MRGPLSLKRRSIESLPDDDVPFDVVDGEMDALTGHETKVREYAWGHFLRLNCGLRDSHHIYQDAAVNGLPNYNYNDAPAIGLQGRNAEGTTRGTPQYRANRTQDNASPAGTLGSETVVAFNSLKAAGLSSKAAKCAVLRARGYFSRIGANAGSGTTTPSKRMRLR